ncbi:sensor histidine kinase [Candidatus Parcubacteria bacterium]|nr:MAG: sensor histidine kinase [Candidatus Parcubacteria bacterium]
MVSQIHRRKFFYFRECEESNLGPFECPSFLFLILGLLNIISIVSVYLVGRGYFYDVDPQLIALLIILITAIFLIISFVIVNAFSKVAEASRLKSEFVGIASHQLRTPLTNIKFSIEYLLSGRIGNLDSHQQEQLKIIADSNERMLKLVSNLLDLSKIEERRLVVEKAPVSLAEVTKAVLEDVSSLAEDKKVKLNVKMDNDLPDVIGDPQRLRMVVQNLTDNAIKYNKEGGSVAITVKKEDGMVSWRVDDTGFGIPRKDSKKVFQKFFRAQQQIIKDHSYGTGLGLYIVRAIIESLGGDIDFSSKEGEGTSFWFYLPIYFVSKQKVG